MHGCAIALRRFEGPFATEVFLHVAPAGPACASDQSEAIYRAAAEALSAHSGGLRHVVRETVFLRDVHADADAVHNARDRVISELPDDQWHAASTLIQQPPVKSDCALEAQFHAVIPADPAAAVGPQAIAPTDSAGNASGVGIEAGTETRVYDSGIGGSGDDAYRQTLDMFERAQRRLESAGLSFDNVVRTWIYLRDIDHDYPDFNRARREFFAAQGITTAPASTGIAGLPPEPDQRLCMGLYAVSSPSGLTRTVMNSPTLNEAASYGADFVRGMRVDESNRTALHLSGTASVNEKGETAHPGDLEAQALRMLVNLRELLAPHGAGFADVVSAITYVKHAEDADRLRRIFRAEGFEGFPNPVVWAPVCRADLLCECELLALLRPVTP